MSAELSEDQVRELLSQAARTVEVGPAGPVVETGRPPRRWVPAALVAAALVVAAVVAGLVLTGGDREVEPARTDEVPPVLGLFREEATTRLQAAGWRVRVVDDPGCLPPGAALGAVPDGREVTLRIASGPFECPSLAPSVSTTAWAFLGILGEGPGTPLADTVSLRVDGGPAVALPADRVGDLDAWGEPAASTLGVALADRAVEVRWTSRVDCAEPLEPTTGDGFFLVRPDDPCGTRVALALDAGGAVTGIEVTTSGADSAAAMPDVRGLTEDEARAAVVLGDRDLYVVHRETTCDASGRVATQRPRPDRLLRPQDGIVLTVDVAPPGCDRSEELSAAEVAAGEALIDLAAGGPAPDVADEVRLFFGHAPVGTLTRAEAADPEAWAGCPPTYGEGIPERACPTPLLSGLTAGYDTQVRAEPVLATCGSWLLAAALPADVAALDSFFVSPPAEEIACAYGYRLQVFLDDQGRVAAVDLARLDP